MCPHPTLGRQGSGLCRRPQNRAVIPTSYCKRHLWLACFPAVVRLTAAGDLSQPGQHIEQKACRQQEHGSSLLLNQDSVCDLLSVTWSFNVKTKTKFKNEECTGNQMLYRIQNFLGKYIAKSTNHITSNVGNVYIFKYIQNLAVSRQ